jgi:glutamyl-Q tRNA(Asp) synthetase
VLGANGEKLSKQNGAPAMLLGDPLAALNAAAACLNLPAASGTLTEALARWVRRWREKISR